MRSSRHCHKLRAFNPSGGVLVVVVAALVSLYALPANRAGGDRTQLQARHQLVTLTDGPVVTYKAAFIGDSYTIGAGASEMDKRWTTLVSERMGWKELNFGHGGTGYVNVPVKTHSPNYLGVLDDVSAANPDVVVVSGGQNDMGAFAQDSGAVSQAIADTYAGLRQRLPNARIVAVGPSVPGDITASVIAFDLAVQTAVQHVGAEYVSLLAPTPVIQQDMVVADGAHVNDSGHEAIADRIVSILARAP
jgi:lysophospholipase L1-like esterase